MRKLLLFTVVLAACDDGPPDAPEYYDRVIQPILSASCIRNQGSCHTDDGTGNALGNLDLTSYENTTRRPDVLRTYGSYPEPLLLLKGAGAGPAIPYKPGRGDQNPIFLDSQIVHAGGAPISRNAEAFFLLEQWLQNGASRDGAVAQKTLDATGRGPCTQDYATARPDLAARYDVTTVQDNDPLFQQFQNDVEPILSQNCALGTCHSSLQSDFFLTCDGGNGTKFNYLSAREFVSVPPESSEFLLRPLAPTSGGVSHTGGVFFPSRSDQNYQKILAWATAVGPPTSLALRTTGRLFFDSYVFPAMLQRGCALEACHSPGSANDFKLRPGSQGYFSGSALARNYEEARRLFLDVDVPDVRQSRVVKKPIVRASEGGHGIVHRGGPVLQSPTDPVGVDPASCPAVNVASPNPAVALTLSPFCTLVWWHQIERSALLGMGGVDSFPAAIPLVYVQKPPDSDRLIDFDQYRPNADLVAVDAAVDANGHVTGTSNMRSLLGNCPGSATTRDVRHPDIDYDRSRVVFAMRTGPTDALDVYVVNIDGTNCVDLTNGDGTGLKKKNNLAIHNFDPIFAPTTPSSIVFASTRGGANGPSLSLRSLLPQSDIWRLPGTGSQFGAAVQMTALTNSEFGPAMMMNGQISFTAEKVSADFYQWSGRRINWDGTDYHPLLGQRNMSIGFDPATLADMTALLGLATHPSVGYQRMTEIREGIDRNFVAIASDHAVAGAGGALIVFNRSVGPFEADRTNVTFLPSMTVLDGNGHQSGPGYRSPFTLPDGKILASFGQGGAYDLVTVDPEAPGGRAPLLTCGGQACVQAVLGYKRERKPVYTNTAQLVFGGSVNGADVAHGTVHYPDFPMLMTLLGANLRTGRFVDDLRQGVQVAVYQNQAPPDVATGMSQRTGSVMTYQSRRLMGIVPLLSDGSVKINLPSLTPLILELQDGTGTPLFTMSEEDQLGPGEQISRGVPQAFFSSVCGGCHGSVSGRELDIAVLPDALTGASRSVAHDGVAVPLR